MTYDEASKRLLEADTHLDAAHRLVEQSWRDVSKANERKLWAIEHRARARADAERAFNAERDRQHIESEGA